MGSLAGRIGTSKTHHCGRCDRAFKTGEERLHSPWSNLSYCIDIGSCERRAKKFANRAPISWVSR